MLYIAAYDIGDEKERHKVARILENYGERVQRSVWLCEMTQQKRQRLCRALDAVQLASGYVDVWPVAGAGQRLGHGALAPLSRWCWHC